MDLFNSAQEDDGNACATINLLFNLPFSLSEENADQAHEQSKGNEVISVYKDQLDLFDCTPEDSASATINLLFNLPFSLSEENADQAHEQSKGNEVISVYKDQLDLFNYTPEDSASATIQLLLNLPFALSDSSEENADQAPEQSNKNENEVLSLCKKEEPHEEEDLACQLEALCVAENECDFDPIPVAIDLSLINDFITYTGNYDKLDNILSAYNTTQLSESSSEFRQIKTLFTATNKKCFNVKSISKVYNPFLLSQYKLMENCYRRRHRYTNERLLFHGTRQCNIDSICKYNFNWRLRGLAKGHRFGQGVCFTPIANYATCFGDKTYEKVMIVAKVLVSNACVGSVNTVLPPNDYDTTTKENGHVIVKYEDNSFYPAYIIYYQGVAARKHNRRNVFFL